MPSRPRQQKRSARSSHRPGPLDAALLFVDFYFPECDLAMLAGSAVHGTATAASDLDIVVITPREDVPRWATFREFGWPIEVFAHTLDSYPAAFAAGAKKRWPLLPLLCRDGMVLRDRADLALRIKDEAQTLLDQGPAPLSEEEINKRRFTLTWLLEDLEGVSDPVEVLLMAGSVTHRAATFLLEYHRRWLGHGKWLARELRRFDPERAEQLTQAVEALRRDGDKEPLVRFGDAVLQLVGGRRFEGQSGSGE
jgi:predicted nucleotidyltransferase